MALRRRYQSRAWPTGRNARRVDQRLLDRGWAEEVLIRTFARRPVPEPPQLRQGIFRVPAQLRHPWPSPSDHREQRHSTLPVPLHVAHRGCGHRAAAAGLPSWMDLLAIATPASIPSPADATAIGATIVLDRRSSGFRERLAIGEGSKRSERARGGRSFYRGCVWLSGGRLVNAQGHGVWVIPR
jgi:hypothetical protein